MLRLITIVSYFIVLFLPSLTANGQVVANFTTSDTAGCSPMVGYFTNTSTGATSYTWDLGNGTTSTFTNVSGSYTAPGTYTVTLTASNGTSTSVHRTTINVYGLPSIRFSASDTTLCPGVTTAFTSSIVAGSPGPLTYNWNFGDGATSFATAPSHGYASAGDYNVTLFVTNGKGCINSLSKAPYIHVYSQPLVGFSAASTYICRSPGNAVFSNLTVGTSPITYAWRFGDGGTSALLSPTHHYSSAGTYNVSLTATDGNGCIDSFTYTSYITVGGLAASFTPVANGCAFLPDTFVNTSTTHIASTWDFGDGSTASAETGVHVYTASGTYNVRLVVYDGTCYDTVTHPIAIWRPTGSFSISPAQPCPPPVTLTFTASAPAGSTISWSSLMRGSLGTGNTLSHLFPAVLSSGGDSIGFIDSVTMILTDTHGCKDTVGRRDTVNKLEAALTSGVEGGCAPYAPTLVPGTYSAVYDIFASRPPYPFGFPPPESISYPYPYAISGYSWNFGDGSPGSTAMSPTHVYSVVGGVYDVTINVTSVNGCSGHITVPHAIKVGSPPPTPSFTRTPSHLCAGQPVYFTSFTSGTFDHYAWDFGDGTADTLANPIHIFKIPGIFNVELKTFYNGCGSAPYKLKDTIDAPNAVLFDSFNCEPRNRVTFVDYSTGEDGHIWQFGDGTTSTAGRVVHTFPAIDTYRVKLITYNLTTGCRDTASILMKLANLRVGTTVYPFTASICRDRADSFVVKDTIDRNDSSWVTKYRWFFEGGLRDSLVTEYPIDTSGYAFHITGNDTAFAVLTDNHGCFDTVNFPLLVAKPVDSFNFTPVTGCAPLGVTFTDHSIPTPGTSIVNYHWSYGDAFAGSTSSPSISHSYSLNGTYSVQEIVTDNIGCKDTFISATRVVVHRPSAAFHAAVTSVCARRGVTFINTSPAITGSLWFFGDGDTSTATSPTHAYSAAGAYSVTLVVTGAFGCTDTLVMPNYITVNPLPHPSFTMSDSFAVCSPFSVTFANTSTGASHYLWYFGDGTSSAAVNPTDVYIHPGYFTVKLIAYNSFGCMDTAYSHVNLFGYSGAFSYTPISGCMPLSVHFTGTFSSVAHVIWDFSDGSTSPSTTLDTISHVYTGPGRYVPKLILTDSFGCTAASYGPDTIKVGNLSVGFTATPNPVCQHDSVVFRDTSSGGVLPITSRLWSFGTGAASTATSPSYAYSLPGIYTVTLTVTGAGGCNGSATKNVTVVSLPPAITGPSVVCMGAASAFTDSVAGGTWSSSSSHVTVGSSSGLVTGASAGVATITYSIGSGCTVTKTVTVVASPAPITGGSNVCVGATITMADATPLGAWSASPGANIGASTGIVTGISPGADTIFYTVGSCVVSKIITVNPLAAPVTGNTHICVGTTSALSTTPAGGRWRSSNTSIVAVDSISGIITGVASGTAVISYIPAAGCPGVVTVAVNPPPGPISGSGFVCVAGSVTLSDAVTGGVWSSSNSSVASIGSASGLLNGVTAGTATITYNAGGCVVIKPVSVNTLPAINGSSQQCVSTASVLTDSVAGGVWSSNNLIVAIVGSSSGIVSGVVPGSAIITYALGGCAVSLPVTVNPLPSTISGSTYVCLGASTTLHDLTTGGVWSSVNTSIGTIGSAGTFTGVSGGVDTIHYTVSTGCAATYMVSVIVVPPITGLSNVCEWTDTLHINDADTTGSFSSTVVTVTNLGGGNGLLSTHARGLASVIYTTSLGCSISTVITVNPSPAPISGTMQVCLGTATTLHDASPGGVWSTADTTATVDSLTGIVTGLSAGTVHIRYTIPTGCKLDTAVTFYTFPYAGGITGPSNVCAGQTITLADTIPGGSWSSSGPATVAGGVVTGVSAGSSIISYSVVNPCGTASATKTITVYPAVHAGAITGPDSVCAGASVTLTDTVAGGTWSVNNTAIAGITAAGVITGHMQGVDTVFYTVANAACSAQVQHRVIVNPLPVAGNLTGNNNLCVGDTTVITASVSGGVWGQSIPNATITSVAGGAKIKANTAGIDTLYYTITNSCGSDRASLVLNIGAPPMVQPINGASDICIGANATLTDTVTGGVWAVTNTGIAVIGSASGIITGVAAGKDTVSYTVANACGTVTVYKPVTVDVAPMAGAINGKTIICIGDSVTLSDSVAGGVWAIDNNGIAAISGAVTVTGIAAGTSALSYSVSNNCGTATATEVITVESIPSGQITRDGHDLSAPAGYASYQWTLNGSPIPGATNSKFTYSTPGKYSVIVSNSLGCSFICPVMDITDCAAADIIVYPNPVSSVIYIQWCDKINARITAADGRLIEEVNDATQLDVSLLPNAIYTLTLYDAGGHKLMTKRVTKLAQ